MPSYERANSGGGYIYINPDGTFVDKSYKPTGKETKVIVMVNDPTEQNTGIEINIPQGMACEMKSGPDINGNMQNWMIFKNSAVGDKDTYQSEEDFFKALSDATDVEWALASNSKTGGGKVFTSFDASGLNASPAYSGGYDTFIHNHPGPASETLNPADSGVLDYLNTHYKDYKLFGIYSEEDEEFRYY